MVTILNFHFSLPDSAIIIMYFTSTYAINPLQYTITVLLSMVNYLSKTYRTKASSFTFAM